MNKHLVCVMAAGIAFAPIRFSSAAPSAASAYMTDPQSEYVQDKTSDGIADLNMVLCVIGSMGAGSMVNAGPYIALVDMNKCDPKKSSGGAAGATNYATAVVDVTRISNSDPMIGKIWLSLTEEGKSVDVFAHLSATQSPSTSQPYGLFRMDYIGKKDGQTNFNGFIDSQTNTISQFETGPNSSNTSMSLSATSTDSGAGTITSQGGDTFDFAYDAHRFRRSDGTNDQCFDRSKANAQRSVWQYGTYRADDGSRVDLAHPGFPILASFSGQSYYGFANYWGINFQGLDLNSVPDAQPVPGLTAVDQRSGNTSSYEVSKVGGKLTKWTQQATTLDSLNNIPINFGGDLTGLTSGNPAVTGFQNWLLQWSSSTQSFSVIGVTHCSSNGCVNSAISPAALVDASAFSQAPLAGWADSYGGNVNIPPTGAAHTPVDPVYYYTQLTIVPGTVTLALHCLSQCPTGASLAAFQVGNSQTTPYGNGTQLQWFSAPSSNTVDYAFNAAGLVDNSGGSPIALVLSRSDQYPDGSMYAQNGIGTGRLFETPLVHSDCPLNAPAGDVCEPPNPAVYYTWTTGPQQWQQSLWLTTNSTIVTFDAPQTAAYTPPSDPAYGSFAGVPILLQFNGFGNLSGIPGYCVDPVDNATVDCSTPNARYVSLFSIPDGATMTLSGSSTPIIVKALNAELRLKNLGPSASTDCSSMTLQSIPTPSSGTHDPSDSADPLYLGTKPTVSGAPKVIDGAVQPSS